MARKQGRCAYCGKRDVSIKEAFRPELAVEHKSGCPWVVSRGNAVLIKPKRRRPTDTERLDCVLKRLRGWESGTGMAIGITTRREIDRLMREEAKRG